MMHQITVLVETKAASFELAKLFAKKSIFAKTLIYPQMWQF